MPELLSFTVVTPSGSLVDVQEVRKVRVRLVDKGLLSVYPYHAPLIGETLSGEVLFIVGDQERRLNLRSGILFVRENSISVYTSGELGEESTESRAEDEAERAERFDRLASVLMSTLRARPQRVSRRSQPSDSET
jgi:F0F1-type ATP synthase epsilon subunit